MDNITLGQISSAILFIVSLIGGISALCIYMKKIFNELTKELRDEIKEVAVGNLRNFMARCLDDVERGEKLGYTTNLRFWDCYDTYINKYKENSYFHARVERDIKEGLLIPGEGITIKKD